MKKNMLLAIALVMTTCFYTQAATLSPTNDTFIDEYNPTTINGSQAQLIVRSMNITGFELDSLLKFNLSSIPSGTILNSVKLNLYFFHYNNSNPTGNPLEAHRITSTWSEATTNWNNRPSYNGSPSDTVSCPSSYSWIQWNVRDDAQNFINGIYTNYGWQVMDNSTIGNSMIY